MSKFKGSVDEIKLPNKIDIGGKTYFKSNIYTGLTPDKSKKDGFDLASGLGYSPSSFGDAANSVWGLTGIAQYKSFVYKGKGSQERIGGSIAKTNTPSTANAGYTAVKQAAIAALPQANDPKVNTGDVRTITHDGETNVGNGGDKLTATINGQKCYFVVCKYSNMYVSTFSFENYDVAEQAAQMTIDAIDAASG